MEHWVRVTRGKRGISAPQQSAMADEGATKARARMALNAAFSMIFCLVD